MDLSLGLAFIAGIASFLSPCVLSLLPVYISYLSGRSALSLNKEFNQKTLRWTTFFHGLAFVIGFTLVFITVGLVLSILGRLLYDIREWISKIGGVVVIILGIHMTGLVRIKFLDNELRPQSNFARKRGYFSSLLLGVVFSAGWSPCVGPVLSSIYMLAFQKGSIFSGFWLLLSYSMGMAVPFLMTAIGLEWGSSLIKTHPRAIRWIEIITGCVLIGVGVLLFLGVFERLAMLGSFMKIDF